MNGKSAINFYPSNDRSSQTRIINEEYQGLVSPCPTSPTSSAFSSTSSTPDRSPVSPTFPQKWEKHQQRKLKGSARFLPCISIHQQKVNTHNIFNKKIIKTVSVLFVVVSSLLFLIYTQIPADPIIVEVREEPENINLEEIFDLLTNTEMELSWEENHFLSAGQQKEGDREEETLRLAAEYWMKTKKIDSRSGRRTTSEFAAERIAREAEVEGTDKLMRLRLN